MAVKYDLLYYIKIFANLLNENCNYFHMIIFFSGISLCRYWLEIVNLFILYTIVDLICLAFGYFILMIIAMRNRLFYSLSLADPLSRNFHSFFVWLSYLLLLPILMGRCHFLNIFIILTLIL